MQLKELPLKFGVLVAADLELITAIPVVVLVDIPK